MLGTSYTTRKSKRTRKRTDNYLNEMNGKSNIFRNATQQLATHRHNFKALSKQQRQGVNIRTMARFVQGTGKQMERSAKRYNIFSLFKRPFNLEFQARIKN